MNSESVALLLDIQRYRSLDKASVRGLVAHEMFNIFIAPRSDYEVNVSSVMRDKVCCCHKCWFFILLIAL
jgi:hypothetical protein